MSSVNISNPYAVTIAEAAPFIEAGLSSNFSMLLQSAPGLGKTQVTKAVCDKLGFDLYIDHPATAEPSDYRGLAFPSEDRKSAQFLPYGLLNTMIHAKKPTVVFFDDIHNAMQANQGPIAQIIEEKRINNHRVSEHVRFIAASNRKQDNAGANMLNTMLLSRFKTILEIKPDADAWCKWAVTANVPAVLIAFVRMKPEMISTFDPTKKGLVNFACPRTLEALGKWINAGVYSESVWAGCVGDIFTTEFAAFFQLYQSGAGNIITAINKGLALTVAQRTALDNNPSLVYMVCASLAQTVTPATLHNVAAYISTLAPELQNFFYMDAGARNPNIRSTSHYIAFATQNQITL